MTRASEPSEDPRHAEDEADERRHAPDRAEDVEAVERGEQTPGSRSEEVERAAEREEEAAEG